MPPQNAKIATAEELLLDYAERVGYHRRGRIALWIRLSRLAPSARPEARQNLVFQLFHTALDRFSGQSFALKDGDVVFAFKGSAERAFEEPLYRLRYSFRDDPLVLAEDEDGQSRIAQIYGIEDEHEAFLAAVREAVAPRIKAPQETEPDPNGIAAPAEETGGIPQGLREAVLSADQIRDMNRAGFAVEPERSAPAGDQVDLASLWRTEDFAKGLRALMRWHPAVRLAQEARGAEGRGTIGREVFRLLSVQQEPARELVVPSLELAGNPALLAYANAQVERGVLRLLADYLAPGGPALIVPLSLDTLLSAEFLELDRIIQDAEEAGRERPRLCFALDGFEIEANPDSFTYAQAFLERGNHRLALAGIPATGLTHFAFEANPVDLVLLEVAPEVLAAEDPALILELRHAVGRLGRERLVLTGCEEEAQVAFGRRLGLCIFEGRAALAAADGLRDSTREPAASIQG